MSIKNLNDKWKNKITLISAIVAIIGGGGILGWYKMCTQTNEHGGKGKFIIYRGSVQNIDTKEYIVGAEITFPGYTNEIFPCLTDNYGSFYFELAKEYPNIIIRIAHKDYKTVEFNRNLTKILLEKSSDNFYLVPIKQQETLTKQPTVEQKSVIRERIEVIGESVYKLNSKWAWEDAEKDAKDKLLRKLGKSSIAYEVDNEKSFAVETEHDGWKATVVIFVYTDDLSLKN